jgi:hypothetical protein
MKSTEKMMHHFLKPNRNQNAIGRRNTAKRAQKKNECREENVLIATKKHNNPRDYPKHFQRFDKYGHFATIMARNYPPQLLPPPGVYSYITL